MGFWTGRTVVYDPAFEEEIIRLCIEYKRLDEALAGLEWALSNSPESFAQLYGSKLRMARIRKAPGVPEMRVWFTFDETQVTVVFAEAVEDEDAEEI
jgi:hypothetical protein